MREARERDLEGWVWGEVVEFWPPWGSGCGGSAAAENG